MPRTNCTYSQCKRLCFLIGYIKALISKSFLSSQLFHANERLYVLPPPRVMPYKVSFPLFSFPYPLCPDSKYWSVNLFPLCNINKTRYYVPLLQYKVPCQNIIYSYNTTRYYVPLLQYKVPRQNIIYSCKLNKFFQIYLN